VVDDLRKAFMALKRGRRADPPAALKAVGLVAGMCVEFLDGACDRHPIEWQGRGPKDYSVYALSGATDRPSRAVRDDLFLDDPSEFREAWTMLLDELVACAGSRALTSIDPLEVDRLYYTAVIAFAVALEVGGSGDRGGPGTFFEMAVGPAVALLTGIAEESAIRIPVPGAEGEVETVTTDLSFHPSDGSPVLVLPTKISTRERISQAYVHQAILEKADAGRVYRSALCIGGETNMFVRKGEPRSVGSVFVRDTLVPNTIVLYQRYISQLSALYYLDPPYEYATRPLPGFPSVKPFSNLLAKDLPALLAA
jgi:hypothetical protein